MVDLKQILVRLSAPPKSIRPGSSREVRAAIAHAIDLRAVPRERRDMVIRNSPKLHTLAFAEQLLALAADVAGDSPAEALELLDAFEILVDLPAFDVDEVFQVAVTDLTAIALIRRAVTLVKMSRFGEADVVLQICGELEFLTVEAAGEYHEVRSRLAAIRQDLPAALAALGASRKLYESIDDQHLVGRVLVAQAFAYGEARDYPASVAALLEACERIDPTRDRRLALAVCLNLARALRDAGRGAEALETIALTREFVASTARAIDRLHMRWLEAGLFADQGDFSTAAVVYHEVATAFAARGLAIEVSEISIEAVEAFTQAGRSRELLPMLVVAEKVFRAQGFGDERLAAWVALRENVADEVVTATAIAAARRACMSALSQV
jgi:tetratricopeptide (TPR) repeat protein